MEFPESLIAQIKKIVPIVNTLIYEIPPRCNSV